jgi:hypothetical protein
MQKIKKESLKDRKKGLRFKDTVEKRTMVKIFFGCSFEIGDIFES